MNLPLINNDNAGNSYLGGRAANLVYAPNSAGVTTQQFTDWINGFFGQACAIRLSADNINLILPISFESLSLPVSTSKARFQNNGNTICSANTNSDLDVVNRVNNSTSSFSFFDPLAERVTYAILNNRSLNVFQIRRIGANLDNSSYRFLSIGWLSNPLYFGNAFPRSIYSLRLFSNLSGNNAFRVSIENTNVLQGFEVPTDLSPNSIVNYPVNCQIVTPGANSTEFYLRDNVDPNKAIGYVPNVLKTSLNIPVGNIYRNTQPDPDGSNQIDWMCVGLIGSERLLMRAWTQGLTS
jgi:hypothetical protein